MIKVAMGAAAVGEGEAAMCMDLVVKGVAGEEAKRAGVIEGTCKTEGRDLGVFSHEGMQSNAMLVGWAEDYFCRKRAS